MQILIVLQLAFNIWMFVDAIRRRMDYYWFFILLMPLGEWVYFFAVKIHDYDLAAFKKLFLFESTASLKTLRAQAEESPSIENLLALGNGLLEQDQHVEALEVFSDVIRRDDEELDALYGFAKCKIEADENVAATRALRQIIELDASFRDWEAWFDLAFAEWKSERRDEAVAVLERLVEKSPRIKHKAILGKYLARAEQPDKARSVLEEAVADYKNAQGFVKRHAGRWANEAQTTLRTLR